MRIIVDIETNMSHDKIWMACTKDLDTGEIKVWKEAEKFQRYIKDASLIVGHNLLTFDAPILNTIWKTKIGLKTAKDTLVLSRLLDPSRENGHSLDAWGKTLGSLKSDYRRMWMEETGNYDAPRGAEFDNPVLPLMEAYCVQDVEVCAKLYEHLLKELHEKEFSEESVELEHQVAAILGRQEKYGFKLDTVHATCLLSDIKTRMAGVYEAMQHRWPAYDVPRVSEKTGKQLKPLTVVFNPGSRQQIGEKLQELGWKPEKFTPSGQPMVDEGILSKLEYPEAKMIASYLLLQKRVAQIESWLDAVQDDGRVHGRVITNGAVTGRMTHHSPNMAQIPNSGSEYGPECRQCWTVEDGNVLVGCDASGLELRMLAHYMRDEGYVKAVVEGSSKDGTDVHTTNQRAAGLETRDQAKTFIYAFLYGAGPEKIGSIVGKGAKAGQQLIRKFLAATPALQRLRDKVAVYAGKGFVPGLDGRKIWVRSEHSAVNSLLQGAGAIVMKKALVILDRKIKANKWDVKFVANVHDEFQMECKPEIAEQLGQAGVDSIREAGEHFKLRCPLAGEFKYGKTWRDTH